MVGPDCGMKYLPREVGPREADSLLLSKAPSYVREELTPARALAHSAKAIVASTLPGLGRSGVRARRPVVERLLDQVCATQGRAPSCPFERGRLRRHFADFEGVQHSAQRGHGVALRPRGVEVDPAEQVRQEVLDQRRIRRRRTSSGTSATSSCGSGPASVIPRSRRVHRTPRCCSGSTTACPPPAVDVEPLLAEGRERREVGPRCVRALQIVRPIPGTRRDLVVELASAALGTPSVARFSTTTRKSQSLWRSPAPSAKVSRSGTRRRGCRERMRPRPAPEVSSSLFSSREDRRGCFRHGRIQHHRFRGNILAPTSDFGGGLVMAMKLNMLPPSVNNMSVRVFVRAAGIPVEEENVWARRARRSTSASTRPASPRRSSTTSCRTASSERAAP